MKKNWLAALLAAAVLCAAMLSGCGEGYVDLTASSQTASEETSSALTETEVQDLSLIHILQMADGAPQPRKRQAGRRMRGGI